MNTLVTHLSPDIDAICAIWLIRKYLRGWDNADIAFVPTGSTLDGKTVDSNPIIIHVDTGYGRFDHHETDAYTSAARLVCNWLKNNGDIPKKDIQAIDRVVEMITFSDHFRDVFFPHPEEDYYLMFAKDVVHHYKAIASSDMDVVEFGSKILDASLYGMRQKIRAEADINEGYVFKSSFGSSIALECGNSQSLVLAQKRGYMLVIQRNPTRHFVKIKLHPKSKKNLKKVHENLVKKDPMATWIYHSSGKMIINGSAHNPQVVASKLSVDTLVDIVKTSV